MNRVTVKKLKDQLGADPGLRLVDVRTPAEYRSGHVTGSLNIPLEKIQKEGIEALGTASEGVFLICESGKRASMAASSLEGSGPGGVLVVEGGMSQWRDLGYPLEGESGMISIERQVRISAGTLVVVGIVLSVFLHQGFILLSGFVGAGLVFAGITDTCGMGMLLARMPWNR
jgi:rhodanese-related sulfurtransferase